MIVRKYLLSFILNIVLEGIFDNIDFKGENTANNAKISNTNNIENRKGSSNSNKIENPENKSNSNNQPKPKKMMIIKKNNENINNAFQKEEEKLEIEKRKITNDIMYYEKENHTLKQLQKINDYRFERQLKNPNTRQTQLKRF